MTKWMVAGAFAALAGCTIQPTPVMAPAMPAAASSALPYKWTLGAAPKAYQDFVAQFGRRSLKPGEYVWAASVPAEGESRVVIDRLLQVAYAYRGDTLVGATAVSTAKKGYITPLGEWTVLEKRRTYRSRKYNNAPMPFMQRIDDYGIALHGGGTPGFPESHGCIHLPLKFAEKLFGLTKLGSKVVIEG